MVARAQAHVQAGELDLAVHVATQAAALRARPDVTLPALARILEAQGEAIAALDAYGQALAAAPDVAEISREMGRLALRLGKHTVAENVLTLHLKRWPATPDVVADLARAQSGQKAFDRAHETLKAALEADASHPILWRTLADLLSLQGRQADAVVFYEESLRLDFDSVDALDGIADALLLLFIRQVLIPLVRWNFGPVPWQVAVKPLLMTRFEQGKGHRAQTGVEVKIEFGF